VGHEEPILRPQATPQTPGKFAHQAQRVHSEHHNSTGFENTAHFGDDAVRLPRMIYNVDARDYVEGAVGRRNVFSAATDVIHPSSDFADQLPEIGVSNIHLYKW
jgi:hypothetical protein